MHSTSVRCVSAPVEAFPGLSIASLRETSGVDDTNESNSCGSWCLPSIVLRFTAHDRAGGHSNPAQAFEFTSPRLPGLAHYHCIRYSLPSLHGGYAMVSTQYWSHWRRCELLVCDILRCGSWNVSCDSGKPRQVQRLTRAASLPVEFTTMSGLSFSPEFKGSSGNRRFSS